MKKDAMAPHKQRNLEKKLAHLAGPHALSWARSDYRDGAEGFFA